MGGTAMRAAWMALVLAVGLAGAMPARGVYTNVVIDGSFTEWSGVAVAATDASGDGDTGPDLAELRIANDESNLYLHVTYHAAINPNAGPSVFVALDQDADTGTGFDVFGIGLIGSDAGWQNDYPFKQAAGIFHDGEINGGGALIAPYNTTTTEQEYAIPLAAEFAAGGAVFPADHFSILLYTDPTTANETIGPVLYALSPRVEAVAFDVVQAQGVAEIRLADSHPAVRYALRRASTPASTNWGDTGFGARGNDGALRLYDASAPGTTAVYRVEATY